MPSTRRMGLLPIFSTCGVADACGVANGCGTGAHACAYVHVCVCVPACACDIDTGLMFTHRHTSVSVLARMFCGLDISLLLMPSTRGLGLLPIFSTCGVANALLLLLFKKKVFLVYQPCPCRIPITTYSLQPIAYRL